MESARTPHRLGGGTVEQIRSLIPSLIPSEQRVALAFVEQTSEVLALSAADLGTLTGTSAATVSRTCRNLGFRGFQHLRLGLAGDLARGSTPVTTTEEPGVRGIVRLAVEGTIRALQNAFDAFDFEAFDAAATTVASARRLLIVGTGGSAPAAQMAALRFAMSGRSCEAPVDAAVQQLVASTLGPGDVCIAISESGSNALTVGAAQAAAEAGATVIAVTAYQRSRLGMLAEHSLVAGATFRDGDPGAYGGGNVVVMLVLATLQTAVADRIGRDEHTAAAVLGAVLDLVAQEDEAGVTAVVDSGTDAS